MIMSCGFEDLHSTQELYNSYFTWSYIDIEPYIANIISLIQKDTAFLHIPLYGVEVGFSSRFVLHHCVLPINERKRHP